MGAVNEDKFPAAVVGEAPITVERVGGQHVIKFENDDYPVPNATTLDYGKVILADDPTAAAGTSTTRIPNVKQVADYVAAYTAANEYVPVYYDAPTDTLSARYVRSDYRGLKISDYLTNDGAFAIQTAELQAALDALATTNKWSVLDLEGRQITIDGPLTFNDRTANESVKPKAIVNGTISAANSSNWNVSGGTPMLTLTRSDGARLSRINVIDVAFQCNLRASGISIPVDYLDIDIDGVNIFSPVLFGITDNADEPGGDLRITRTRVERFDASTAYTARTTTAIAIHSNDFKLTNVTTTYCKTGLYLSRGSGLVQGCHFYQGLNVGATPTGLGTYNPCVRLVPGNDIKFTGCYFDNSPVAIDYNGQITAGDQISFESCVFTVSTGNSSYRFVVTTNGQDATALPLFASFARCTFRSFNPSGHPTRVFDHASINGYAGTGFINQEISRVSINDCWFRNVPPEYSDWRINIPITSPGGIPTLVYSVDLTNKTPWDIQVNEYSGPHISSGLTKASPLPVGYVKRLTSYTFEVRCEDLPTSGVIRLIAHAGTQI